jgi:hypothetical protein
LQNHSKQNIIFALIIAATIILASVACIVFLLKKSKKVISTTELQDPTILTALDKNTKFVE